MPTRYLKPGIRDSALIDSLSPMAETLFCRLLVTVDDFGRADARPAMVKASCYPIKASVTPPMCGQLLDELNRCGLVHIYEIDDKPFLQVLKWDNSPRAQVSKFPAPPGRPHAKELLEIVSEADLEAMVSASIAERGEFAGLHVISHATQVRHGQSYLDIVLTIEGGQVGIELKRTRISKAAVEQVVRYAEATGMPFILIGSGLGTGVDLRECAAAGVAVAIYDENFSAKIVLSSDVFSRDFTLRAVVAKTVTVTVTGTETGTETKGGAKKPKRFDPATIELPDWLDREAWGMWVKDRSKRSKPVTEIAAGLQIKQLEAFLTDGHLPEAVIAHTIAMGWTGLRAPQVQGNPGTASSTPLQSFEERADAAARGKVDRLINGTTDTRQPDVFDLDPAGLLRAPS